MGHPHFWCSMVYALNVYQGIIQKQNVVYNYDTCCILLLNVYQGIQKQNDYDMCSVRVLSRTIFGGKVLFEGSVPLHTG